MRTARDHERMSTPAPFAIHELLRLTHNFTGQEIVVAIVSQGPECHALALTSVKPTISNTLPTPHTVTHLGTHLQLAHCTNALNLYTKHLHTEKYTAEFLSKERRSFLARHLRGFAVDPESFVHVFAPLTGLSPMPPPARIRPHLVVSARRPAFV